MSRLQHVTRLRLVVLATLLAALAPACRQASKLEYAESPEAVGLSSARLVAVHDLLAENVDKGAIAGAAALVIRRGQVAYVDAVGKADVEAGRPMQDDTLFRICSMSKPITSAAVMILADEGRLSLTDPVAKFIPEFRDAKVFAPAAGASTTGDGNVTHAVVPAERPVTIRHLLTHTSGLCYGFAGRPQLTALIKQAEIADGLSETSVTLEDNARRIAAIPLINQPGAEWEYGLSTDVLGRVVEVASGMPFDRFLEERLFKPLGMEDTQFRVPAEKRDRLAAAYRPGKDGRIERLPEGKVTLGALVYSASYPYGEPGAYRSGGAGLVSTVPDYARFLLMLRNGGELDGHRILKHESVLAMTSNQLGDMKLDFGNHGDQFGLGFGLVSEAGKDRGFGSPGTYSWGGFYYTYFWVDPRKDLIAVVMAQLHPWDGRTLWDDFRKRVYAAVE
jgi:CubicO group peptidase (beta-lactamase class C family)